MENSISVKIPKSRRITSILLMKDKLMNLFSKRENLILFVLFFVSLSVRILTALNAPIYGDEITWMVRGKEFVYALLKFNFDYFKFNAWWLDNSETQALMIPIAFLNGLFHLIFAGEGKYSLKIFSDIFASRLPLVLINSALPPLIYFYGKKFFSKKTVLLASVLYALNPIAINIDTWLLADGFLTLFSFLAIVTFLSLVEEKRFSIIPGLFLGLAVLIKPNGILPVIFWLVLLIFKRSKLILKLLIGNLAISYLFTLILWPGSWSNPITAFFEYNLKQTTLVQVDISVFYFGRVTFDPGWSFYFFQFLVRMPEIIIFGLFLALINIIKSFSVKIRENLPLASYLVIFFIVINLSANKFGIRYMLPLIPWLIIFSASGLVYLFETIKNKYLRAIYILTGVVLILYPLSYLPNFNLYYNAFIGGAKGAQNYDMVGLCASSKPAFDYLNSINYQGTVYVAGCQTSAEYYTKIPLTRDLAKADAVVLESYFRKQRPEREVFKLLEGKTHWKTFQNHGATIAEIYLLH